LLQAGQAHLQNQSTSRLPGHCHRDFLHNANLYHPG